MPGISKTCFLEIVWLPIVLNYPPKIGVVSTFNILILIIGYKSSHVLI